MTYRFKAWATGLVAAITLGGATSANAVPTYGDIGSPGVFFGSGNINGNWTIDTSGGIEVALRAKNRATLATIDGSSGIYQAQQGLCNPICGGGPKAMWNYELSVNTGAGVLASYLVVLRVDTDPSAGKSWTDLNVLTNWPDTAFWNGSKHEDGVLTPTDFAAQQSANPLFGDSGFGFLPGPGLYDIELAVYASTDTAHLAALARTGITVQVVPEPDSIALVGLALFGLGAVRRNRKA